MKEDYAHRLMVYELAVGRARWYGAGLAAVIAYLAGGQVSHPTVMAFVTVGVVAVGTFLMLYVLLYERAMLLVKWLIESGSVGRSDEVDSEICPRPVLAGIFRLFIWQLIGHLAVLVVFDRLVASFPAWKFWSSEEELISVSLTYLGGVAIVVLLSVVLDLARTEGNR